jgi:hypothetical protein
VLGLLPAAESIASCSSLAHYFKMLHETMQEEGSCQLKISGKRFVLLVRLPNA